jgi:hypothetical protein
MERGEGLQDIASDQLLRFTSTRALAGAIKQEGKDIEEMGVNEAAEGMVRLAVSDAAAERSQELSQASDALAARGVDELMNAEGARDLAREAVVSGVVKIADGANEMGKGEALQATGEVLEDRADR